MEIYEYKTRECTIGMLGGNLVANYTDSNESEFISYEELSLLHLLRVEKEQNREVAQETCGNDASLMHHQCVNDASLKHHQCFEDASLEEQPCIDKASSRTSTAQDYQDNGYKYDEYLVKDAAAIKLLLNPDFIASNAPKYRNFTELKANVPQKIVDAVNRELNIEKKYTIRTLSPVVAAMRIADRVPKAKVFFYCFASAFVPTTICAMLLFGFPSFDFLKNELITESENEIATESENVVAPIVTDDELDSLFNLNQNEAKKIDDVIEMQAKQNRVVVYKLRKMWIRRDCSKAKDNNSLTDAKIKSVVAHYIKDLVDMKK